MGINFLTPSYYDDRQWHNVLNVLDVEFKQETYIDIDARMGMFKIGYYYPRPWS